MRNNNHNQNFYTRFIQRMVDFLKHPNLPRLNTNQKKYIRVLLTGMLIMLVVMILIASVWEHGRTASYTWTQTTWSGGADDASYPTSASNQSNWTKYASKDSGVTINGSNQITLANSGSTVTHTTDAHWNAGTASNVTVASNSVTLSGASVLTDSSLDFDAADESAFTQEDSAKTQFSSGVAQLELAAGADINLGYDVLTNPGLNANAYFLNTNNSGATGFSHSVVDDETDNITYNLWYKPPSSGVADIIQSQAICSSSGGGDPRLRLYLNADNTITVYADDGATSLGTTDSAVWSDRTVYHFISLQYEYNAGSSRYYLYVDRALKTFSGNNYTAGHATINDGIRPCHIYPRGSNSYADEQIWKGLRDISQQTIDYVAYNDGKTFATLNATAGAGQELIVWVDWELGENDYNEAVIGIAFRGGTQALGAKSGTAWRSMDSSAASTWQQTNKTAPGPLVYPTSAGYYITTNTNQINTSSWTTLESVTTTETTPTNTQARYLVSFDGRTTWKYWSGSAWTSTAIGNIHTSGMSKTTMEAITQAQWSASGGFSAGTFDIAAGLKTTDTAATASVSQITVGYTNGYVNSGNLTSATIDTGSSNNSFGNIVWTATNTTVTKVVKFQIASKTSDSGWVSGDFVGPDGTTSTYYTTAAGEQIRTATNGKQYIRYKAFLEKAGGDASGPSLDDLSIIYNVYPASATLTSSAFNTQNSASLLTHVSWTETLPSGTNAQFQVRTSADNVTWSSWCGPDNTASGCNSATYFTDPAGGEVIDADLRDVSNDQWIQYKLFLTSDGTGAPIVSVATMQYVINIAPVVSSVTASQASDGTVTAGYTVADDDNDSQTISLYYQPASVTLNESLTSGDTTAITVSSSTNLPDSGTILIDSEIITYTSKTGNDLTGTITRGTSSSSAVSHTSGTALFAKAVTVSGNVGASITPGASKSIIWTATTDIPSFYGTLVAKIHAYDGNAGNQFASANATSFNLDTKLPSSVSVVLDGSASSSGTVSLALNATDDNTISMKLSNNSGLTADGSNATSGSFVAYATSVSSWTLSSGGTVYASFKDTKSNTATTVSATMPGIPSGLYLADVSNTDVSPAERKMFVSWSVIATPSAGFANYKIYRKTEEAGTYALLATVSAINTNYYSDTTVANGTARYYYYVISTDSAGNVSYRSSEKNGVANGTKDSSENGTVETIVQVVNVGGGVAVIPADVTKPLISNILVKDIKQTEGTVSWATNEDAISKLVYGPQPTKMFAEIKGSQTEYTTSHAITIAGLTKSTSYFVRVYSKDKSGNEAESEIKSFTTLGEEEVKQIEEKKQIDQEQKKLDEKTTDETPKPDEIKNEPEQVSLDLEIPKETSKEQKSFLKKTVDTFKILFEKISSSVTNESGAGGTADQAKQVSVAIEAREQALRELVQTTSQNIPPPFIVDGMPLLEVTASSAQFYWKTDRPSNSIVALSPDNQYIPTAPDEFILQIGNPSDSVTEHIVNITSLQPAVTYFYQVRSQGVSNETAKSKVFSFVTKSEALRINSPSATEIEPKSMVITWSTNLPTDSLVEYTPLDSKGYPVSKDAKSQGKSDSATIHRIELTGLGSGTRYMLRIVSRDQKGNSIATTLPSVMTLKDTQAPQILTVDAQSTLYPGADAKVQTIITWKTNETANSQVLYAEGLRKEDTTFSATPIQPEFTKNHVVVLTNLKPGQVYQYKVKSADEEGNVVESEFYTLLSPQSTENVIDVIADNFVDIFGFLRRK